MGKVKLIALDNPKICFSLYSLLTLGLYFDLVEESKAERLSMILSSRLLDESMDFSKFLLTYDVFYTVSNYRVLFFVNMILNNNSK